MSYAQVGGATGGGMGGGMGNIPGTAYGGATDPSMVQLTDGFRIIPTIAASQRYDSNVFFLPKTAGVDRSDYVSTLAPQIRGLYAGSGMKANAVIGANASYFVKNTDFNYVGANAGLSLNFGPMLDRLWQGMVVTVTDTFQYTPQPPSFLVGDQPNNTSASGTPNQVANTSNLLMNGMQVGRVSSTGNNFGGTLIAPLNQTLSLSGGYSRGFIRFGTSDVQQVGLLLNTSYQTFNIGILTKLTPQDSVTLSYLDSNYSYGGAGGSFTTRGGTVAWMHLFSPTVTMASSAGVQVFDGGTIGSSSTSTTTSTGVSQGTTSSSSIVPTGSLSLTWRDQTTSLSLAYGLMLTPSYQFDAQPILANTVSFSVVQVTPVPQLSGLFSVNYARGDEFGSSSKNSISYSSYSASGGALYKFTSKTFLNLNYQYSRYDSQFGLQGFSVVRQVVTLNLVQAFF